MNTSKIALYTDADPAPILTPAEVTADMFAHTDESGTLYIPEPMTNYYFDEETFLKIDMDWNKADSEKIAAKAESLTKSIKDIAAKCKPMELDSCLEYLSDDLKGIWSTYICGFDTGEIDAEYIESIDERLEIAAIVKRIGEKIDAGIPVTEDERAYYDEYREGNVVFDAELEVYDRYWDIKYKEAEKRVGSGIWAYDEILYAQRLCALLTLNAPEIIIKNEVRNLTAAMAIHAYAKSIEVVTDVE